MRYQEADWAWLAGLVDGEGSFNLLRTVATKKPHHSVTYKPSLQIGMTDTKAIVKSADMLDSPVYHYGKTHKGERDEFRVSMQGRRLGTVLLRLLPWLSTKRQQAELLRSFILDCPPLTGGKITPPEELALREGYHLAVKYANANPL